MRDSMPKGFNKNYPWSIGRQAQAVFVLLLIFVLTRPVLIQAAGDDEMSGDPLDTDVIETEIGFDEVLPAEPPMSIKPKAKFKKADVPLSLQKVELTEHDIIQLNRSLRRMIEDNERLIKANKDLDRELRSLRGQWTLEQNRIDAVVIERDAYKKQNDIILQLNKDYEKDLADLKGDLENKEKELAAVAAAPSAPVASKSTAAVETVSRNARNTQAVIASQNKGMDVIEMLDKLKSTKSQMRQDEARVHYNMGNLFFKQGEYRRAAREYRQALHIAPQDPSAHFNLAFVSGEYLNDPQTALKHFKKYLVLNPQAKDGPLVQEKIIDAEMRLKTRLESHIESELRKEKGNLSFP